MIGYEIKMDRRFVNKMRGRFEAFDLEVGVLRDGPHKLPKRGERGKGGADVLSKYAGGPVRKVSSKKSDLNISEVSKDLRERIGVNYFTKPFESKNDDIMRFSRRFFEVVQGKSQVKRLENLMQAIVRNPILRGDYGSNSALSEKIKGFNRFMIDTGQLFKALKAKAIKKAGRRV